MDAQLRRVLDALGNRIDAEHDVVQTVATIVTSHAQKLDQFTQFIQASSRMHNAASELAASRADVCDLVAQAVQGLEAKSAELLDFCRAIDGRSITALELLGQLGERVVLLEKTLGPS